MRAGAPRSARTRATRSASRRHTDPRADRDDGRTRQRLSENQAGVKVIVIQKRARNCPSRSMPRSPRPSNGFTRNKGSTTVPLSRYVSCEQQLAVIEDNQDDSIRSQLRWRRGDLARVVAHRLTSHRRQSNTSMPPRRMHRPQTKRHLRVRRGLVHDCEWPSLLPADAQHRWLIARARGSLSLTEATAFLRRA
jgi:hypothetical protein